MTNTDRGNLMSSFKVEKMYTTSNNWTGASSGHGTEQAAIFSAKLVKKGLNVAKVRVIDNNGNVCYID